MKSLIKKDNANDNIKSEEETEPKKIRNRPLFHVKVILN